MGSLPPLPMLAVMRTDLVTCDVEGGIAHVRLNRPDKLNALTLDTLDGLIDTASRLATDRTLRGVIVSGAGDSFCAGLDFATVLKDPRRVALAFTPRPWRRGGTNTFQEACWAWRHVPVPVVAAVQGHCFGGGLQIALGADFRFTTADAQWSVLEARWGLIPDMSGIQSLSELVGIDQAKRLTMTGEVISGERAVAIGLATEAADNPYAAGLALLEQIATRSPDSVAAAKRLLDRTWTRGARHTFSRERVEQAWLLASANTKAARKAAFDKAAPVFAGRTR